MAHIAAVASSLKSSSALLPPSGSDAPALGDDFAAVLAGIAPKTQGVDEQTATPHAQALKIAGKVPHAVPVPTNPLLRLATSGIKPHAKAQVQDKSSAAPKSPKPVLAQVADEKDDKALEAAVLEAAMPEAAMPDVPVMPVRPVLPLQAATMIKSADVPAPEEISAAPVDAPAANDVKPAPHDAPRIAADAPEKNASPQTQAKPAASTQDSQTQADTKPDVQTSQAPVAPRTQSPRSVFTVPQPEVKSVAPATAQHVQTPAASKLAANTVEEIVAAAKGAAAVPKHMMAAIAQAVTAQAIPKTAPPVAAEKPALKTEVAPDTTTQGAAAPEPKTPGAKTIDVKAPDAKPTVLAKMSAVAQAVIAKAAAAAAGVTVIDRTPLPQIARAAATPQAVKSVPAIPSAPQPVKTASAPQEAKQAAPSLDRNAPVKLADVADAQPAAETSDPVAQDTKASAIQAPSATAAQTAPAQPAQTAPAQAQAAAIAAPAQVATVAAPKAASAAPAKAAPDTRLPNIPALATAIAAKSVLGARAFEIRLDPAELGHVEVHLSVSHDGKAEATLYAERPATLALLQRDSHDLERSLKEAGLDLSNSSLNFSLKGEGRQGDGGGASTAHKRSLPDAVVARSEAVNASLAHYSLASDGARLDIRV